MRILLILIFVGVPIAEIALFIQAGDLFGLWPTLAAVIATAIIGAALLRAQGLATLERARQQVDRGQFPVHEVFTGICLLIGGALLLTPGFLTDAVGFLLLVPQVRQTVGMWIALAIFRSPNSRVWVDGEEVSPPRHGADRRSTDAIDVEYTVVPDPDDPSRDGGQQGD